MLSFFVINFIIFYEGNYMNLGFSYIRLINLIISTIILGIGHIAIHLNHRIRLTTN